jgi:ubiquitin C-terminal hydrolase
MGPHKVAKLLQGKRYRQQDKNTTKRLGKIFTYPKSDRGLISNIYNELKKVGSRISNNHFKKWGSELNKEFSTEEYGMAEKYLKKMFNILTYQGNGNQNNPEISPHTSQNG